MANKIINFPELTKQEMMDLSEIVYRNIINDGSLESLVSVHTGVESGDRLAWVDPLSMVGKKSRKCNPENDDATAALSEKIWDLQEFDVRLAQCYADYEHILYRLGFKNGVMRGDMTGTEFASFLEMLLTDALEKMYKRFLWFGDTAAANISDGGEIANAYDPDYFNVIDGVWKQISEMEADPTSGIKRVVIEANTFPNYTAQITGLDWSVLEKTQNMILAAPIRLSREADKIFYVSKFWMDKLKYEMVTRDAFTESQFAIDQNGLNTVTVLGQTITEIAEWDEIITTALNDGTKYNDPFRAIYTTKSNIALGVPSMDTFKQLNAWYEKKDRIYYIEAMDRLDVIVMLADIIVVAR